MPTVTIWRTPLNFRVKALVSGYLIEAPTVYIGRYAEKFSEHEWDRWANRWIRKARYLHYNKITNMLHFPRYDYESFIQLITSANCTLNIIDIPTAYGKEVEIPLDPAYGPKDAAQAAAIDYLVDGDDGPMRGLAIQTGQGKTFSAITTIARRGRRGMICVGGMTDQWVAEIKKFTLLWDEDIYVLQGQPSVDKLFKNIDQSISPKIIVASIDTLRGYARDKESYSSYPPFDEFCDYLQIGVRVIDEAHLDFFTNMMIDLRLNVALTIPLTATFGRENRDAKRIFDAHYPPSVRFGEGTFKKYVSTYAYRYQSGVNDVPTRAWKTPQGYSHAKYEDWLLTHQQKLLYVYTNVYRPIIEGHYLNIKQPGQRLLILCATVAMCNWFETKLRLEYPDLTTNIYIGETDDEILSTSDIIVSTPGSCGTGRDVKQLRSLLATISIGGDNLNKQVFGRLRELPNGDTPVMVYSYHTGIGPQIRHHEKRKAIYMERSKTYTEVYA